MISGLDQVRPAGDEARLPEEPDDDEDDEQHQGGELLKRDVS